MPAEPIDTARRSVVPPAARLSLWRAAAWTGLAPVVVAGVLGIVAVALCWLPASGTSGNADSVIRAGLLTYLAALHGGITVDGVATQFVPLGLTAIVALLAWRAGAGLADTAAELDEVSDERPRGRLVGAGVLQVAVFALAGALMARLVPLGTSHVNPLAAAVAGLGLFGATGSVAFARAAGLLDGLPDRLRTALRAAGSGLLIYVGAGALLTAASVVWHRDRVELLSQQVGGGWAGVPVLLLGVLAAPNAAVASASYLAGPGFALGSGSPVGLSGAVHGTLPAFPLLGAVPSGPANSAAWLLATATPIVGGLVLVRAVRARGAGAEAWLRLAASLGTLAALGALAAWLAGGSVGSGRLSAVGASPWQFGLAIAGGTAAVAVPALGALTLLVRLRRGQRDGDERRGALRAVPGLAPASSDDASDARELAG